MHKTLVVTSLVALILPIACVEDQAPGDSELLEVIIEDSDIAPFAEVDLEPGHKLAFYSDGTSILVTEVTPPGGVTVLRSAQETGATSLEVYRAVAPDAPLPRELEAAHPNEARARGRADTGVHPLTITAAPLTDDPPCTTETTFETWFYWVEDPITHASLGTETYSGNGPVSYYFHEDDETTHLNHYFGGCNKDGGNKTFSKCSSDDDVTYRCWGDTSVAAGSTWFAAIYSDEEVYAMGRVEYPSGVSGTSRMCVDVDG